MSRGKFQAWERGQRPSADDLETIGRRLGLSGHWLLFREGEPEAGTAPPAEAPAQLPAQVTGMAPAGDPLTAQMEAFERIMRARNAPDEEVRDGLLALVRNYRPGYPTAEAQQKTGPYGSLGEAAEEPAPYSKKNAG